MATPQPQENLQTAVLRAADSPVEGLPNPDVQVALGIREASHAARIAGLALANTLPRLTGNDPWAELEEVREHAKKLSKGLFKVDIPKRQSEGSVSGIDELTRREREILTMVAEGHSNSQLAKMLFVTEQTVKFHLSNMYRKTDTPNRTALTALYNRHLIGNGNSNHGEERTELDDSTIDESKKLEFRDPPPVRLQKAAAMLIVAKNLIDSVATEPNAPESPTAA